VVPAPVSCSDFRYRSTGVYKEGSGGGGASLATSCDFVIRECVEHQVGNASLKHRIAKCSVNTKTCVLGFLEREDQGPFPAHQVSELITGQGSVI